MEVTVEALVEIGEKIWTRPCSVHPGLILLSEKPAADTWFGWDRLLPPQTPWGWQLSWWKLKMLHVKLTLDFCSFIWFISTPLNNGTKLSSSLLSSVLMANKTKIEFQAGTSAIKLRSVCAKKYIPALTERERTSCRIETVFLNLMTHLYTEGSVFSSCSSTRHSSSSQCLLVYYLCNTARKGH